MPGHKGQMVEVSPAAEVPHPMVSVIVGNHNGLPKVENCLRTILGCDYDNLEVVLVDGGSTDGSVGILEHLFGMDSRLKIVELGRNVGSSKNCNAGAEVSTGDIIVFADSDVEVSKSWLTELVFGLERDPSLGALMSVLLEPNVPDTIQCAGIFLIDFCGWTWSVLKGSSYQAFLKTAGRNPVEIGLSSNTAMAVTREAFERIGGFDEGIFMYFEEIDFSWRLRLAGYKIAVMPTSTVTHFSGEIRKQIYGPRQGLKTEFKDFDSQRNNLRMIIKNFGRKNLLKFVPTALMSALMLRAYSALTGKGQLSLSIYFKAVWWTTRHLPATIKERRKVQSKTRARSDDWVIGKISRRLPLSEMLELVGRRRRPGKGSTHPIQNPET